MHNIRAMIELKSSSGNKPMRLSVISTTVFSVLLGASAWAEIYETTDEEGNTVFSDVPTRESQLVDLPEANIADSVERPPQPATKSVPSPQPASSQTQRQSTSEAEDDDDDVYLIGDSYDKRLEEKMAKERRQEVLEGERPHEVLGADPPRDMGEAGKLEKARPAPHPAPHVAPRR
jgi:hypothetical protein